MLIFNYYNSHNNLGKKIVQEMAKTNGEVSVTESISLHKQLTPALVYSS